MSDQSKIEWTDATWNPVSGCSKVSPGCAHCYAERLAIRFGTSKMPWTPENAAENVTLHPERLALPLSWRKPRRVFVNSMSDLFHERVPDEFIDRVFSVMALAKRHTFQVLTKRPDRMREYMDRAGETSPVGRWIEAMRDWCPDGYDGPGLDWPLPNVWLGVSAENQYWADRRIPVLLHTPAAVRFVSAEPLLGPIKFSASWWPREEPSRLDWVIAGGESGPGARPMDPAWARSIRDQCFGAGVSFFFKQWGEWKGCYPGDGWEPEGMSHRYLDSGPKVWHCGKKRAGRDLDGRTWGEMPDPGAMARTKGTER